MSTEIAVIKLRSAMGLDHPFFASDGEFRFILRNISEAAEFTRGFWGIEDEDNTILRVFMNWDPARDVEDKYVTPRISLPALAYCMQWFCEREFQKFKGCQFC